MQIDIMGAAHEAWRITADATEIKVRSPLWEESDGIVPNPWQVEIVMEYLDG